MPHIVDFIVLFVLAPQLCSITRSLCALCAPVAAIRFDLYGYLGGNFPACPPYGDLEKYKGGPGDLSMMSHEGFQTSYKQILADSVKLLKDLGVFCIVTVRASFLTTASPTSQPNAPPLLSPCW